MCTRISARYYDDISGNAFQDFLEGMRCVFYTARLIAKLPCGSNVLSPSLVCSIVCCDCVSMLVDGDCLVDALHDGKILADFSDCGCLYPPEVDTPVP